MKNLTAARLPSGKYALQFQFRLPGEDMFETATHAARFATEAQALAVRAQILERARRTSKGRERAAFDPLWWMDKAHWQGPTSQASPIRWNAEIAPYDFAA